MVGGLLTAIHFVQSSLPGSRALAVFRLGFPHDTLPSGTELRER